VTQELHLNISRFTFHLVLSTKNLERYNEMQNWIEREDELKKEKEDAKKPK